MLSTIRLLVLSTLVMALAVGCKKHDLLATGTAVPTIALPDQNGTATTLQQFEGSPLVVYFYPKDNTPGCTTQACAFRDVWDRYSDAGVQVVGVSTDSPESHASFAEEHALPFPLLSDENAELARSFGLQTRLGMTPRVSFLVDKEGIVRAVYPDVDPGLHATDVLEDALAL